MELVAILKRYLNTHGLSGREFARTAGLTQAYVSKLMTGKINEHGMTLDTFSRVAGAMGMTSSALMTAMESPATSDSVCTGDLMPYKTDEQVQAVTRAYINAPLRIQDSVAVILGIKHAQ